MRAHVVLLSSLLALSVVACGGATSEDTAGSSTPGPGNSGGTSAAGAAGKAPGGAGGGNVAGAAGGNVAGAGGGNVAGAAGSGAAGGGGYDPCAGRPCGASCNPCDPKDPSCVSPGAETFCSAQGKCVAGLPSCGGPQCKTDGDCPVPDDCFPCPDGSLACTSAKCAAGQCVYSKPTCSAGLCDPMVAVGVGGCEKLLGYAWNGKECLPLGGCSCDGPDCGKLYQDPSQCKLEHEKCFNNSPCAGKVCGEICSTCVPGGPCAGPEYCDASGVCSLAFPSCGGGNECMSPKECPAPKGPCVQCDDGSLACPYATCLGGKCGVEMPPCGGQCQSPDECPVPAIPCKACPDGSSACPYPTCLGGKCGVEYPACQSAQCKSPADCPVPGVCENCPDGTFSCATATCVNGQCGVEFPGCGVMCKLDSDCPPGTCSQCPDGSTVCSQSFCLGGQCVGTGVSCPPVSCNPMEVKGVGDCKLLLGFHWDGQTCSALSGCECAGADCGNLYKDQDLCLKAHADCGTSVQCKTDLDCPLPGIPCQQCADGSQACPSASCVGGQCQYAFPGCPEPCSPMDAQGVGPCALFLGYSWNGKQCVGIGGCNCEGADCGKVFKTSVDCEASYKACLAPTSPCSGKKCGDVCSNCTGDVCPPFIEYCNMKGDCTPESPACTFP